METTLVNPAEPINDETTNETTDKNEIQISRIKIGKEKSIIIFDRGNFAVGNEAVEFTFYDEIHPDFQDELNKLLMEVIDDSRLDDVWREAKVTGIALKNYGTTYGVTISAQLTVEDGKININSRHLNDEKMRYKQHVINKIIYEANACISGKRANQQLTLI